MDDPRLSRMYLRAITRDLTRRRRRASRWMESHRRGMIQAVVVLLLIAAGFGYYAHRKGRFRRLKTELKAMHNTPVEQPVLPGGQEAVVLQRPQLGDSSVPEFLSATLLPGRGMSVLQLTAYVPGHGEVGLLSAPSLEDATAQLTGKGADANGQASLHFGGPIQAPWAGFIPGPIQASQTGGSQSILAEWHGRQLALPLTERRGEVGLSQDGLLLKAGADAVTHNIMPDGGTVQTSFEPGDLDGSWPSQIRFTMTALLSSRSFELRVQATNEGSEVAPVGVGWVPRFVLPSGNLRNVLLRIPADQREEIKDSHATGRRPSVQGTPLDYSVRGGKRLAGTSLSETFTDLKSGFLDNGPMMEVRDVDSSLGLRMTALSPTIRAAHVQSDGARGEIALGFQTNYDDPLARVWSTHGDPSIQLLQPGQTLQWKVRLELFQLMNSDTPPL